MGLRGPCGKKGQEGPIGFSGQNGLIGNPGPKGLAGKNQTHVNLYPYLYTYTGNMHTVLHRSLRQLMKMLDTCRKTMFQSMMNRVHDNSKL